MTETTHEKSNGQKPSRKEHGQKGPLIVRQKRLTRIAHWLWAVCFFFLLPSGLQIFNAHPTLYWGRQSGFGHPGGFSNAVFSPGPFPGWATIPSFHDLATGRVVHFFFAWLLVITLAVWLTGSLIDRHVDRDLLPKARDWRGLWTDIIAHLKFHLVRERRYSPLQKLTYFTILFLVFPLQIATGLAMSPGLDAAFPILLDVFGGRQSARTLHFAGMAVLAAFFAVHIAMVILAGPLNELRSMITGKYRLPAPDTEEAKE